MVSANFLYLIYFQPRSQSKEVLLADHPDGQANGEVVSARTASATGKKKKKKKKKAGYAQFQEYKLSSDSRASTYV